tara:strand:- start:289 stop:1386 length:1098 start_codon:yes stop_codon:yes gene_type:complete
MKKFFFILSSILVLFVVMNFFLAVILTPINNFITVNILNKPVYSERALKIIGINRSEERVFYNETWNRKFKYIQFVEHYEAATENQKYVNVSKENGRSMINNTMCMKNFYFYGSSLTFGYNVKDSNTIPSYFKNILDTNYSKPGYCVFNFGSASYFSTQETILFETQILNNKIKEGDFIFFIDGHAEGGNQSSKISSVLDSIFTDGLNSKMLGRLNFSFTFLWDSLPTTKIYNVLRDIFKTKKNYKQPISKISENELRDVFQKNVLLREAICKNFKLNCFTFLQPIPNINVIYNNEKSKEQNFNQLDLQKQDLLRDTLHIYDISDSLDNIKSSKFESGHYTPESNKAIAETIFDLVNKRLLNLNK